MSAASGVAPAGALRTPARLLLAHHGTAGALAAQAAALAVAVPGATVVVHCQVVPALWAGMQGDDWLNNASTRDAFARHLEGQLEAEARAVHDTVAADCRARGIDHRAVVRVGDPAEVVAVVAAEVGADLVVIGPPRRPGESGLRCRMNLDKLVRGLQCPLLIASRP